MDFFCDDLAGRKKKLQGKRCISRFYRVLTMVYKTQNYWGFGLYPSSGF
jgi:hypothetical protein